MSDRVIYHIDCNAFYASVEELIHPELKTVPMAVCGDPESRRGIILAKNQLAKDKGVKTAETIWQARQKCPDLVLAPARRKLYREYCERVNAIYEQYTDMVERAGIDESYLDVTGSLHLFGGDALALAHEIRQRVTRETGLTVSVGISFNKVFAKLGSDYKKPDAVTLFSRENYRELIWPLPVSSLLLVGRVTGESLARLGVETVGDLAGVDPDLLRRTLGKVGEALHHYANGLDDAPVHHTGQEEEVQSVGNGMTFKRSLVSREDIRTAVTVLADEVARRLRHSDLKCRTVQITVKDDALKVITRQKGIDATWLADDLARGCLQLIEASWKIGKPIRMLTVTASRLIPQEEAVEQISLFEQGDSHEKRERLEQAMDKIRDKYGAGSITPGSVLNNDLGIEPDE